MKTTIKLTSGQRIELDNAEYPIIASAELSSHEEGLSHRVTIIVLSNGTDHVTYGNYHVHSGNVSLTASSGIRACSPYTVAEGLRNQLAESGFLRPFMSRLLTDIAFHPDLTKGELT